MFFFRTTFILFVALMAGRAASAESFRVQPYVQNPAQDAMTVRWLSDLNEPGVLTVESPDGSRTIRSQPTLARALAYNPIKLEPGGPHPGLPWLHSVRVSGLKAGTTYSYRVRQGTKQQAASFHTAPSRDQPIRFLVYSDPETEPESTTSPPVEWPAPANSHRPDGITRYVTDQTTGYRENCRFMATRNPDFILLTGDLVETGGEQRDWDEFWRHNSGDYGEIAASVPILPALGNHENFAGPGGGYSAEGANFATDKFLTYFEVPANRASNPKHEGRYYRIDYGPITIITLDSSDGLPHRTPSDTNYNLEGSNAPDYNPGSEQYRWFERQLADAQKNSRFTFVQFHHTMYGSGPHSIPFGHENFSGQSGIAMRVIEPLLFRYGVDVVFSGHDEMLERSLATGTETRPDGSTRSHSIHFYDVGIGGDGLRGPSIGFDNPYRKFLAHDDAPEVWNGKQLVSGGKHYGHIEVNVAPNAEGTWQVELTPVHIFPRTDISGAVIGWERRIYDDVVTISSAAAESTAQIDQSKKSRSLVTFSVMGDIPYSAEEYRLLPKQIADLPLESAFVVHLGDIKTGQAPCDEVVYETVAALLAKSKPPLFIIPGDNEYNDCAKPDDAWKFWVRHFNRFEEKWKHDLIVKRQKLRDENFAFVRSEVLFIGINIVGGRVHDADEWKRRHAEDLDWTLRNLTELGDSIRSAVVFGHAFPIAVHDDYFTGLSDAAKRFKKPILYLHGDGHRWIRDRPFAAQNILRIQVDQGGIAPPVTIAVTDDLKEPFVVDRRNAIVPGEAK